MASAGNEAVMRDVSRAIRVEVEREDDGRWLAEVPALSGALAYGQTREDALAKAEALALRILAERLEHGEPTPELDGVFEAA
jgi:predicted RNase H-like HicB family nuclease